MQPDTNPAPASGASQAGQLPAFPQAAGSPPPSYFSQAGISCCSKWVKLEIEILAWAYVTGMARDGDVWHKMDSQQCYDLLTPDEQQGVRPYLPDPHSRYIDWWEMIGDQLKDAAGAFDVGGLAWGRWRYEKANK